jgi:spore coat polysaccharide biosynthesis protein SpsF (cytidylyltransferase family)
MKKKILGIILCRSNSTRLKNKLKLKINDQSIFKFFFNRISQSKKIDDFIISTTHDKRDDYFVNFAIKNNLHFFRGSANNVLSRVKKSIEYLDKKHDIIIRCNADNPLVMPTVVDEDLIRFGQSSCDFFSPFYKNSTPFGYSFSIFKSETLLKLSKLKLKEKYTEHIDNYFIENQNKFKILTRYNKQYFCPNLFLTLDTKFDLDRIRYFALKIKDIPIIKQPKMAINIFKKFK